MSSEGIDAGDKISEARKRIQTGAAPEWASERRYPAEFKGRPGDHVTYLLFDRQIHAELRQDFFHGAIRLETMEAVQQQSQWQFTFEPGTQSVTFHFIKIRRGETCFDHLNLGRGRLLQREEGLHRFVIDGWYTFLLVLEDVRPGDVLEWAFTITTEPRLLSEYTFHYCGLPEGIPLGTYRFSVRFNPARPMKWRTSMDTLKPNETMDNDLMRWTWIGNDFAGSKFEINTPSWHRSAPWFQVSDCPDWGTVARAVSAVWAGQASAAQLQELIAQVEVNSANTTIPARIEKAIQLVQDDFRYLSVNLEFGGQIPATPDTVARRRYGDCKDLSFLLVNLLKHFGVLARPVLVNSRVRKVIGDLLPSPNIFDHAIVEFEAEGKRRWVDPTLKYQGGDAFNRIVPLYGKGLVIDPETADLSEAPEIPQQSHIHELHETILLDTTGAPSLLASVVRAEGDRAEILRREFAQSPLEEIAKKRVQACANRFVRCRRTTQLQYRDDRTANQFMLVEVFEVEGFLQAHPDSRMCRFNLPCGWLKDILFVPEKTPPRMAPLSLPYPCQITHIIDIEFPGLHPQGLPKFSSEDEFFKFNRTQKIGHQFCVMNFAMTTLADSVPVSELEKYRKAATAVLQQSSWNLNLRRGISRPRQKRGFGELPLPSRPRPAPVQPVGLRPASAATVPVSPAAAPADAKPDTAQPELSIEMQAIATKTAAKHVHRSASEKKRNSPAPLKSKGGFWRRLFGGS